ncbi:MAG: dihydrolipoamide acetyltransferase family protein [Anaerolineales bacterium]|jgi:2-oxoglutarate dehydrogenase E2 component (dihydrolipoamide succinyltransferase)
MATKVLVPRLGEGVDELTVVKWLKTEGSEVKELESLLEVETDKVVTEIPSPATGIVLKILVPENTSAQVGEVMAWIGQAEENVPATSGLTPEKPSNKKENQYPAEKSSISIPSQVVNRNIGFLSPVVRKIAAESNLDLSRVQGTGLNGRITKQDVLASLEKTAEAHDKGKYNPEAGGTILPVTSVRRQIAERMLQSRDTSPHVLTVMEADMSRVAAHRAANKASFSSDGINLTYTAYFIAAIAAGLKAYPLVNSSWTEEGILVHPEVNVGMATSLGEEGLIVPVLRRADELSLLGIARAVNDLSERARTKKLQPEEVRGGTFTLTNHGISGSLFAMPIINQPQVGILGVGAIQKRAVIVSDPAGNDAIAILPMVYLSFVFDHRILDGASADAFLAKVKQTLVEWKI